MPQHGNFTDVTGRRTTCDNARAPVQETVPQSVSMPAAPVFKLQPVYTPPSPHPRHKPHHTTSHRIAKEKEMQNRLGDENQARCQRILFSAVEASGKNNRVMLPSVNFRSVV